MDEDFEIPLEHRHGPLAHAYRAWKRDHGGVGGWLQFEHWREVHGPRPPAPPAPPLTPEQERARFLAQHDTGDLDAREKSLLAAGIAPSLTPGRAVKRFGAPAGILLFGVAAFTGASGAAPTWLALLVGGSGLALVLAAMAREMRTRR